MFAKDKKENLLKVLSMGADDYMIKPVTSPELSARIVSMPAEAQCSRHDQGSPDLPSGRVD